MRADSGFFDGSFLDFLEERGLPYVVVARMTSTLKRKCAGIQEWTPIDEHLCGRRIHSANSWAGPRNGALSWCANASGKAKAAVGRKLIDVPGYTFRVWVTNRSEGAVELWRDYNGRATCRATDRGIEARSGGQRVLPAPVLCDRIGVPGGLVHLQPVESVSASDDPQRSVSAAGDLAHGGVPVRGGAGE